MLASMIGQQGYGIDACLLPRKGRRSWTASWPEATQNQLKQGCQQRLHSFLQTRVAVNDKGYDYADNGMAQGKWYAKCYRWNTEHYQELQAEEAESARPLPRTDMQHPPFHLLVERHGVYSTGRISLYWGTIAAAGACSRIRS